MMNQAAQAFKVFVVEDSPSMRDRLLEMLASIDGIDTIGSADGADAAIQAILAARPDAITLDMNLAQGSGMGVLRALHQAAPEIEIWMVSNFVSYRDTCLRLGATRFFDKTTELELMREAITARAARSQVH